MATTTAQRRYWIFTADPHHYHWDTLFVKGKEMWDGAGAKPDAIRALKQVRKGDRVLCYHSAPERALYSTAEVTRRGVPGNLTHGRDCAHAGYSFALTRIRVRVTRLVAPPAKCARANGVNEWAAPGAWALGGQACQDGVAGFHA